MSMSTSVSMLTSVSSATDIVPHKRKCKHSQRELSTSSRLHCGLSGISGALIRCVHGADCAANCLWRIALNRFELCHVHARTLCESVRNQSELLNPRCCSVCVCLCLS